MKELADNLGCKYSLEKFERKKDNVQQVQKSIHATIPVLNNEKFGVNLQNKNTDCKKTLV